MPIFDDIDYDTRNPQDLFHVNGQCKKDRGVID